MPFLDQEKYSATSLKRPADLQTWPKPETAHEKPLTPRVADLGRPGER